MRIPHLAAAMGLAAAFALPAADLPRPLPAIAIKTPAGGDIELKPYRGKVVALEFLLTTCPACQRCSRNLQKLQTEYGPNGFQAIGVATNDISLVPRYVRDLGLQFPVGFVTGDEAKAFLQHSVMESIRFPQMVLIDRRGIVRTQHLGCDEAADRARIVELLEERDTGPTKRKVVGRP